MIKIWSELPVARVKEQVADVATLAWVVSWGFIVWRLFEFLVGFSAAGRHRRSFSSRTMSDDQLPLGTPDGRRSSPTSGISSSDSAGRTRAGDTSGSARELRKLGIRMSATTVRTILIRGGLDPAPRRAGPTWTSVPANSSRAHRYSSVWTMPSGSGRRGARGSTRAAPSSPPPPWTAHSPGGASRSSATGLGGGRPPSPTRGTSSAG